MNNSSVVYHTDAELAAVELFKDYPSQLLDFMTAICVIFMMIGIPGNIITIAALAKYEKVRNATAMFIMNLSTSDLLFCCFNVPVKAALFWNRSWPYGILLCRMYPMVRYILVAVSVNSVLAITINRYIMILHPRLYPKIYKTKYIVIMLAAIWLGAFCTLLPTWLEKWGRFGLDPKAASCTILEDSSKRCPKHILYLCAFVIPYIAIIFCYSRIFYIIRKAAKKSKPEMAHGKNAVRTSVINRILSKHTNSRPPSDFSLEPDQIDDQQSAAPGTSTNPNSLQENTAPKLNRTAALRKSIQSIVLLRLSLPTRKDRRLATMIIAIMICFCLCHLPITIIKSLDLTYNPGVNVLVLVLLYLSTSINPVVYVVMSDEYRKAYKNLFNPTRKT